MSKIHIDIAAEVFLSNKGRSNEAQNPLAVINLLAEYREKTYLEACSAICDQCRYGDTPREMNDVLTCNGKPYWHELRHSGGGKSGTYGICEAASIRKLMEPAHLPSFESLLLSEEPPHAR